MSSELHCAESEGGDTGAMVELVLVELVVLVELIVKMELLGNGLIGSLVYNPNGNGNKNLGNFFLS